MRGSERPDPVTGPLETMSQGYFANLDRIARAYEPALKGIGRYNLELLGLATRRTQAWLDIPASLGRCRTPQDLQGAQTRFWQVAAAQYTESWQRMAGALSASVVMPGLNGTVGKGASAPARDIITFPDAPDEVAPADDKRSRAA